jgi:hypothetical protein
MQGRVVGEAEIVAKPDDTGGSGIASHQVVNSEAAGWVHARTMQLFPVALRITLRYARVADGDANRYPEITRCAIAHLKPDASHRRQTRRLARLGATVSMISLRSQSRHHFGCGTIRI